MRMKAKKKIEVGDIIEYQGRDGRDRVITRLSKVTKKDIKWIADENFGAKKIGKHNEIIERDYIKRSDIEKIKAAVRERKEAGKEKVCVTLIVADTGLSGELVEEVLDLMSSGIREESESISIEEIEEAIKELKMCQNIPSSKKYRIETLENLINSRRGRG